MTTSNSTIDERNSEIVLARMAGGKESSYKKLAKKYNLSETRVSDICRSYRKALIDPPMGELARAVSSDLANTLKTNPFNPSALVSRKGLGVFDTIRKDDQVKAALWFKKTAAIATGWEIVSPKGKPDDWAPRLFIEDQFLKIEDSFSDVLIEVLTALDYGYCLHGDTLIHTPSGDFPIKHLVGQQPWVFCWDPRNSRLKLGRANRVWCSQSKASCIKVTYKWWSGPIGGWKTKSIVCTENHPFLLLSGHYVKAGRLNIGDRLTPFSQKFGERVEVRTKIDYKSWCNRARWVCSEQKLSIPIGYHVHHINGDSLNDAPENLEIIDGKEHIGRHSKDWFINASDEQKIKRSERAKDTRKLWTPEVKAKLSASLTSANIRSWQDPETRRKRCEGISKANKGKLLGRKIHTEESKAKISAANKASWARKRLQASINHEIISIEPCGKHDVYDIQVPYFHNFAANHVFVHNSVGEILFNKIESGKFAKKIGIRAIKAKRPHTINFVTDEFGNLEDNGVEITVTGTRKRFPTNKFIIFSHQKEFSNHYGRSDLETVYRIWWIKENSYRWLAMLLERFGIPPVFILYNPNTLNNAQINKLLTVVERIQAATAGAIPRVDRDSIEMWTPQLAGQTDKVFIPAIEMFNRDIARGLLMPGLLGMTADDREGSFARARVQFDVFLLIVERLRRQLEDTVVLDQIIKPLIDLNFDVDEYPIFKFLPITDALRLDVMKQWGDFVEREVVIRQDADETHIRSSFGFPRLEEEGSKHPRKAPESKGGGKSEPDEEDELKLKPPHQILKLKPNRKENMPNQSDKSNEVKLTGLERTIIESISPIFIKIRDRLRKKVRNAFGGSPEDLSNLVGIERTSALINEVDIVFRSLLATRLQKQEDKVRLSAYVRQRTSLLLTELEQVCRTITVDAAYHNYSTVKILRSIDKVFASYTGELKEGQKVTIVEPTGLQAFVSEACSKFYLKK